MRELTRQDSKNLEDYIDRAGIEDFLVTVSMICGDKAVYLAEQAQDANTGKYWAVIANKLGMLAMKTRGYAL